MNKTCTFYKKLNILKKYTLYKVQDYKLIYLYFKALSITIYKLYIWKTIHLYYAMFLWMNFFSIGIDYRMYIINLLPIYVYRYATKHT